MLFRWKMSTGGVHVLEKAPNVHVHFLNEVRLTIESSFLELCCHGCGVGQIVLYDSPLNVEVVMPLAAIPELVRFRDAFEDLHVECRSKTPKEYDCVPERTLITSMDLREEGGPVGFYGECGCACHFAPVEHATRCCSECPSCLLPIAELCVREHSESCVKIPSTVPDSPDSKREL